MDEKTELELQKDVVKLKEQMRVNGLRIDALQETTQKIESLVLSVQKLAMSVEIMAKEQVDYRDKQNEIASRLLEVERQPDKDKAQKHDEAVRYIFTAIAGAVLSYIFTTIFGL